MTDTQYTLISAVINNYFIIVDLWIIKMWDFFYITRASEIYYLSAINYALKNEILTRKCTKGFYELL
jgi:hypothetical protein